MANEVFVDASAWIAVSNSKDKYHPAAVQLYQRLVITQRPMLTTNNVMMPRAICVFRHNGRILAAKDYDPIRQQTFYRPLTVFLKSGQRIARWSTRHTLAR